MRAIDYYGIYGIYDMLLHNCKLIKGKGVQGPLGSFVEFCSANTPTFQLLFDYGI